MSGLYIERVLPDGTRERWRPGKARWERVPVKMKRASGHGMTNLMVRLYRAQEARCFFCDGEMTFHQHRHNEPSRIAGWTRDHLIPWSRGGRNHRNVVLSHYQCNALKGDREPTPEELERCAALYDRLEIEELDDAPGDGAAAQKRNGVLRHHATEGDYFGRLSEIEHVRQSKLTRLYLAQGGRCFICGYFMAPAVCSMSGGWYEFGWTRLRLSSGTEASATVGDVVLTHRGCNMNRGGAPPTEDELERLARLYDEVNDTDTWARKTGD